MSGKSGLSVCALVVVGLLTGCGASDESADSGDQHLEEPTEAAAPEPTDKDPLQLKVSCNLKNDQHEATVTGPIKVGTKNKILAGTTLAVAFKSGVGANLTVKSGSVQDLTSHTASLVLAWHKLGVDIVNVTIDLDGEKQTGKSISTVGDFDFDTQCTFDKV